MFGWLFAMHKKRAGIVVQYVVYEQGESYLLIEILGCREIDVDGYGNRCPFESGLVVVHYQMLAFHVGLIGSRVIVFFAFDVHVLDRYPVLSHALLCGKPHALYRSGEIQSELLQVRVEHEVRVELFPNVPVVVQI